jgi:hypothetical protein
LREYPPTPKPVDWSKFPDKPLWKGGPTLKAFAKYLAESQPKAPTTPPIRKFIPYFTDWDLIETTGRSDEDFSNRAVEALRRRMTPALKKTIIGVRVRYLLGEKVVNAQAFEALEKAFFDEKGDFKD